MITGLPEFPEIEAQRLNSVEKSEEKGISGNQLADIYLESLKSGEACQVLGDKVLKPRKLRSFILDKIDA